jgi:pullulanase-type alpha-1,6-glucosidase
MKSFLNVSLKPLKPAIYAVAFLLTLLTVITGNCLAAPVELMAQGRSETIDWVGNMFIPGYSDQAIINNQEVNIYTQVHQTGVTEPSGQGANITCTLYWSEVDLPGGVWKQILETPMVYNGDIGNNDEYRATISPSTGLYEYTTSCRDRVSGKQVWQQGGNGQLVLSPIATQPTDRRALWINRSIIAWNDIQGSIYELHYSLDGNLTVPVTSGTGLGIQLRFDHELARDDYPKFPNIGGYEAWYITSNFWDRIPEILQSEIAVAAYDRSGKLIDATGVQIQGVLDDLYTYNGELGVLYEDGIPTLKLWAPTAQAVTLHRFEDAQSRTAIESDRMELDPETGVWSVTGDETWNRQYYIYELAVYVPSTGQIEKNLVTDPYSVNLSKNSRRSQILDLYNDPSLKPEGWDQITKPDLEAPEDIAIYEVHVRDFSRDDLTVAPEHRGTFKAFTYDGQKNRPPLSDGMNHLSNLAKAGLTHVHLLPVFNFTSVGEDANFRVDPDYASLSRFRSDSVKQQAIVGVTRGNDSFNWGYDPYHYGVPEGSYATRQNDETRIIEFREMVQSLAENDLHVVLDMVFNHTFASGLYTQSVLDKVVPTYYHRYNNEGYLQNSSCCADTAAEFNMMEKLMVDMVTRWAKAYKIDGFRFDLMNLHPVDTMIAVRDALHGLTLENDGVDGKSIYLYGEGWDFGSAKDKGLYYANQYNMAGTGIGTFNDKIRDAIHGGYSEDSLEIRRQGFINGQSFDWNGYPYVHRFGSDLRHSVDRLRVNLAGSLRDFYIQDQNNNWVSGSQLSGAGYTADPQESINYASKHDNETLYDLNVFKLPLGQGGMAVTSMEERVRVQNLALSLVGLSQGIPFFHMGSDMLRSKSLDRNSYDSGDWFNRVDFTYETNNFGVGLPPAWNNESRWSIMAPLLSNPTLKPTKPDILNCVAHLQEVLKIRKSSRLFRLETAEDIRQRVQFYNTGPNQSDGLIVMSIRDTIGEDLDPQYDRIFVLFNADKFVKEFTISELRGSNLTLHPVQIDSHDDVVKTARFFTEEGKFLIPPRTMAVFVSAQTS